MCNIRCKDLQCFVMFCNILQSAICNVVHLEQWLWAWRCTCYCYAMFAMMCNVVHLGQWLGEMYLLLLCNVLQSTILCKCFAIWCKVQSAMLCNPQYYALFRNIVQSALCNVVHLGQGLGAMWFPLMFISSNFSHSLQARSLETKQTFHASSAFFHHPPFQCFHQKNH